MFANVLPWQAGSKVDAVSTQHLGLQHHRVSHELARTEEELAYLPCDALQVLAYFMKQLRHIAQWLVHESSSEYACMGRTHLMHVAYARVWRRLSKAANDFIQCELIRLEEDV